MLEYLIKENLSVITINFIPVWCHFTQLQKRDDSVHLHPCEKKVMGLLFRTKFQPDPKISIDCVWCALIDPLAKLNNVISSLHSTAYIHWWSMSALVEAIVCHLFGTKPLPEPVLAYCQLEQTSMAFESKCKIFHPWKCIWKCRLQNAAILYRGMSYISKQCY